MNVCTSFDLAYDCLTTSSEPTAFIVYANGEIFKVNDEISECLIVPGSFNPIHEGHVQLALAANRKAQKKEIFFELSVLIMGKGSIELSDLKARVQAINKQNFSALLTNLPLFCRKSAYLRKCAIAVGYDTFIRIINKKYYNESDEEMEKELNKIVDKECVFYVGGRLNTETNTYQEIQEEDNLIPFENMKSIFLPIPSFRVDISSTELRKLY